jgi:hypothetical protein
MITVLFALFALAQAPADPAVDRVFRPIHTATIQDLQELATMVRSIGEIRQVSVDSNAKSISMRGTPEQIAMAEWLVAELDQSAPYRKGIREYAINPAKDDHLRIIYIGHADTIQTFQEVATLIRSITEIRYTFTYNAPRAIAVRGTTDQMMMADWLVRQIDEPVGAQSSDQHAATRELHMPGTRDDILRVFYVNHTDSVQSFQEVATMVRSISAIPRLFTYNETRAIAARGTAEQMAMADWMIKQLNQPAGPEPLAKREPSPEFRVSDSADDVVRIFYLTGAPTLQAFQQSAVAIRAKTQIRRVFTYNAPRALAVRGTAAQLAVAEQLVTSAENR